MDFESILESMKNFIDERLLGIVFGLCVLFIGWLAAVFLVGIIKKFIFRPLKLNENFAWITARQKPLFDLEKALSRLCFLVMLLILALFAAQSSGFEDLESNLSGVLTKLGELFLIAWNAIYPFILALVCAFLARKTILSAGTKFKLDERIGSRLDAGEKVDFSITRSFAEISYGIVFLLFLPRILSGLGLEQLSMPIQPLIEDVGAFIPRIIAASLIVVIGWFVARLIRQIFENFLVSTGVDNALKNYGSEEVFGSLKVSKIIPAILYAIVVIFIIIKGLEELKLGKLTEPIDNILNQAIGTLPQVAVAIVILMAGLYLGGLLSKFISDILKDMGFNNIFQKLGIAEIKTGTKTPSELMGTLAHYSIVIILLIQALDKLGLQSISKVIETVVGKVGDVLLGLVVFAIGLYIANLVSGWVKQSSASGSQLLALLAKGVIIVVTGAMALQQMEIAEEIVTIAFSLAMGSIALGTAIAIGLGCKDLASEVVRSFVEKLK